MGIFETTIRVLGGLLSAHLMAIDDIGLYNSSAAFDRRGGPNYYYELPATMAV